MTSEFLFSFFSQQRPVSSLLSLDQTGGTGSVICSAAVC